MHTMRRHYLVGFIVGVTALGNAAALADPTQHLEMFLDDVNIASSAGVVRQLNEPDRLPNPVITGAGSWDPRRSFGTVIYDESENLYKAWYQINAQGNSVAYATSTDGLDWDYPSLGLVSFPRDAAPTPTNTTNNMVFRGLGHRSLYNASVIKDDADPDPSRRYKIAYFDSTTEAITGVGGVFTGTSPDGIHWTRTSTPAAPQLVVQPSEQSTHDVIEMMYDSQKQKYVLYTKGYDRTGGINDHRQIVRTESSDFINWTTPQVVLEHDNSPIDPQSYGASVFEYQGMYVMLLRIYHNNGRAGGQLGDRTIDVQLAASRDGVNWTRVADKATFMHLGDDGAWDDGMILPYRPFEKDGRIQIYYHGWNGPHENPAGSSVSRVPTVGLATLDAGRFVAMRAAGGAGALTTGTFTMQGEQLFLNADLGDAGVIGITLLDEEGDAIAGFTAANATLTRFNDLYYAVTFTGGSLTALRGDEVSVRFQLAGDAALYGYTTAIAIVPEPATAAACLFGAAGLMFCRRRDSAFFS